MWCCSVCLSKGLPSLNKLGDALERESTVAIAQSGGFLCRPNCGACCTAPSITSPIPGMPQGKLAGERCVQLDANNACKIFGQAERPLFCVGLQASAEMCGDTREQAMQWIARLETLTRPDQESAVP
jgi:uncharacterized protein